MGQIVAQSGRKRTGGRRGYRKVSNKGHTSALIWLALAWVLLAQAACNPRPPEAIIASPTAEVSTRYEPLVTTSNTPTPLPTLMPTLTPIPPVADTPAAPTPTPSPTAAPTPTQALSQTLQHVVQPGDTLLGLAREYSVPMASIQLGNDMGEATTLWAGQVLTIVVTAGSEDASPFWMVHLVETGETLSSIASDHGLRLADLKTVNNLSDTDLLAVGQALILPLEAPVAVMAQPTAPRTEPPLEGGASSEPTPETLPTAVPTAVPPPVSLPGEIASWPHQVLQLINQLRAAHGLYPLAYNDTLAWAAQLHAADCQQRGWCSHYGSDGSDPDLRILRAGYAADGSAECWVQSGSPQDAVNWWMDETPPNDPHRRTLLSSYVTEVGIGVVATDSGYFFIADFGRPG